MNSSLIIRHVSRDRANARAFTLLELLVVITIIIILISMLFPAFRGVQDQAKKAQAKNDTNQIAAAINAYYTEYGKYPIVTDDTTIANTADLFYTLRAVDSGANANNINNPRQIVFIQPTAVKDTVNPKSGIGNDGQYYDPWGAVAGKAGSGIYQIRIDGNYDNQITNPYVADKGAGPGTLRQGVIVWSLGVDGALGTNGDNIYKDPTTGAQSDDVISWQ